MRHRTWWISHSGTSPGKKLALPVYQLTWWLSGGNLPAYASTVTYAVLSKNTLDIADQCLGIWDTPAIKLHAWGDVQ